VLPAPVSAVAASAHACRTLVVSQAAVAYPDFATIEDAVDQARPCDWTLAAQGVYRMPVVVRTPRLHLRGLDRNRVVIDGGHRPGNGIDVRANDVWIENLTVRNFDRRSLNDEEAGNEVRWRGVHGWHGNYLTVYDTGLLGGYGLWARTRCSETTRSG
jgi:nitrous oxidase accessory protein NosD